MGGEGLRARPPRPSLALPLTGCYFASWVSVSSTLNGSREEQMKSWKREASRAEANATPFSALFPEVWEDHSGEGGTRRKTIRKEVKGPRTVL